MTLGEKIRKARTEKKITQAELCKNHITRNMLSAIERDKATPSLDTISFLAERLSLPLSYLVSSDDNLFFYAKKQSIGAIKRLYSERKYKACIEKIDLIGELDDELHYLLAQCYFELGRRSVLSGSLSSGSKQLILSSEHASLTIYDTARIENSILIYSALTKNIQSPLLEFDSKLFEKNIDEVFEYDFYKYLTHNPTVKRKNHAFSKHMLAKEYMKERKYKEAITLLKEIENEKTPENYNVYVIFGVYSDMEHCYKQLMDFESAYRYASKRLSIIEGFQL